MHQTTSFLEHLRAALQQLDDAERQTVTADMLDAALDAGMWMDGRDAGKEVPVALEPSTVSPAEFGYLQHTAWQMRRALQQVPDIIEQNTEAAALLELTADEEAWFESFRSAGDHSSSRFCRIDALFRGSEEGLVPDQLSFIEPNVVGLGGLCYDVDSVDILETHVFEPLVGSGSTHSVTPADDPRTLLARELEEVLDSRSVSPPYVVALVGSQSGFDHDGEDERLVSWLNDHTPLSVVFADPADVRVVDGDIVAGEQKIDLIYRMMELSDLVDRETKEGRLDGMRAAFERGIVIPTVGGDLEHKSVFELFTSDRFAEHFTQRQREVFDRHVLWTRLLSDRQTRSPSGRMVDLPTFTKREREQLVLKPNRSHGGVGVQLGSQTSVSRWTDLIEQALADDASYVVQQLAPLVNERLPVMEGDSFEFQEVFTVVGIFPSTFGCGLLGRYAEEGVVNVSRSGGVRACMVDFG
jgi:hypothetical protein